MKEQMMEIRAFYEAHTGQVAIYITKHEGGKRYLATNLMMEEVKEGSMLPPTLRVDLQACKNLPNDLDACGLLPTALTAQKGELAATKYHLEDIRLIARMKTR
jgi:hypothetical protein